jgi:hypothetical protein
VRSASDVKMCETARLGKHQRRKRSLRQVEATGASKSDGGSSAVGLVTPPKLQELRLA